MTTDFVQPVTETPPTGRGPQDISDDVIALVRSWLETSDELPTDFSAKNLAGVLADPGGLDFTVGFVDGVIRPEDRKVAARNLKALSKKTPSFLPWYLKRAVNMGGSLAPAAPDVVIPTAQAALRRMVGHLIVDARENKLGPALKKIRGDGNRLNINLLGEAVLGDKEAGRRLEGTKQLLARDDVDYVSIKVSSTVAPHPLWAHDESVYSIIQELTPLYEIAAESPLPKFINLDMEEYKDLHITMEVFRGILEKPQFKNLRAGIVVQAYLPDSLAAVQELTEWAQARVADGGAPIKIRVVKGANLPMEEVEASIHDWPLATWGSKQDSDTSYKSIMNWSLTPERLEAVQIGVAGHNLFDIAFAWLLAGERGVQEHLEFEMLLGMAQSQAKAVSETVGNLLLYTPVVHPKEFDVAIAYLIRRLEEVASQENFMSAVFELSENEELFEREKQRFIDSLRALTDEVPGPNRTQNRAEERPLDEPLPEHFENIPDTDPSLLVNVDWGRRILERSTDSTIGIDIIDAARIDDEGELNSTLRATAEAGKAWGERPAAERAEILHRAGQMLSARRADLLEVMASEAGKTLDQGDAEVSEAADFAHYYAEQALTLDEIDGADFVSADLTLVTPPWNFPVAIPAGSTLAALASGSAVVIKPAGLAERCGAVMVQALWDAGVPREVLKLVQVGENELGRQLIAHDAVDRVILTGAYETAELFRSFRPDLPLLAETSGKNSIIVMPSADFDLAAKDVVYSAFGHAGQKCSAASTVILVGSAAESRRFMSQLEDGVRSLRVGIPQDARTQMGPIIAPAEGKLLDALTTLEPGQQWLIKPQRIDTAGKMWSPGVRTGVQAGSDYHLTEYFGPILGIMTADTLDEAIELQNAVDYGLTAGIHSLDAEEIDYWLQRVQAGNLYVNRGITGAIVRRQPFGGWKKSAVGPGTKAGGPSYLYGLGDWTRTTATGQPAGVLAPAVRELVGTSPSDFVARSVASDQVAWENEFGLARDVTGLFAERNVFRYLPTMVRVRLASGGSLEEAMRVIAAGLRAGGEFSVSTPEELPSNVRSLLAREGIDAVIESDEQFLYRMAGVEGGRIRLIGQNPALRESMTEALGDRPDVAVYDHEVTEAGRIEMLPFLHEQAVSITAHRFGTPDHLTDDII